MTDIIIAAALSLTAAWHIAVLALGGTALSALFLSAVANLAWVGVIYRLFASDGRSRSQAPIRPLVGAVAVAELCRFGVSAVVMRADGAGEGARLAFETTAVLGQLAAVGALLLIHNLYAGAAASSRAVLRWPTAALAAIWGWQLNHYAVTWFTGGWADGLAAFDGLVAALAAALFAVAANTRAANLRLQPSRTATFRLLSLAVIAVYFAGMLVLTRSLDLIGGDLGRLTQAGFAFVALIALVAWLPSRRVRGWLRIKTLKHLFEHRYDYRAEWMRFNQTVGRPGSDARDLPERAAQALADITDSQGGIVLLPGESGGLELAGRWEWDHLAVPPEAGSAEFIALLERTGAVIELDEVRRGGNRFGERDSLPAWMLADLAVWALVPLIHFNRLAGVVVLARPPYARSLDWEDFDLLKVAGNQLASYLAEQRGHDALMEAARFDEFNRRIAFVMHDIKNLASQLSLLARNAERHADNPEFRKDMLVTLTNSSAKLNALLARLGRYGTPGTSVRAPFDLAVIARRVVKRYAAAHRVQLLRSDTCKVLGDADGLEQALVHLVQNAIDASPPELPVYLDLSCDGLQGRLEVVDSGTGMAPQFVRDGLFRPFVSSKDGGFGIGAFEARELVRAMGGRVEVESRPGIGTRFAVVLPLSAAAGFLARPQPIEEVA